MQQNAGEVMVQLRQLIFSEGCPDALAAHLEMHEAGELQGSQPPASSGRLKSRQAVAQ